MLLVKVAVSRGTRGSVTELPDTDPNNPPAPSASAAATIEDSEAVRRRYLWVADLAISFIMSCKLIAVPRLAPTAVLQMQVFGGCHTVENPYL